SAERIHYLAHALERGWPAEALHELTRVDPWYLDNLSQIVEIENDLRQETIETISRQSLRGAKREGFSDQRIADLIGSTEDQVRATRRAAGVAPVFKRVDTCGAEFESFTPYLYSTYEAEDEADVTDRKKIMILGSGPNRIGQGIEFDYCC